MQNLEQFRELFNPLPGNHYLYVTTTIDEVSKLLQEMMQSIDGRLDIALYNKETKDDFLKLPSANIQHVEDFSKPFRALPRDHDIVVLKDVFYAHKNRGMILKNSYLTLANTANIIIMEKKGVMNVEAIKTMLEDYEFRAPNEIDIVDGYDLVMAKKMHMWGNGL